MTRSAVLGSEALLSVRWTILPALKLPLNGSLYVLVVISQLCSTIWLGDCACELPVVIAPIHGRTP
jgi:hypothetical protein